LFKLCLLYIFNKPGGLHSYKELLGDNLES